MSDTSPKKVFPATTPEVAAMMGLQPSDNSHAVSSASVKGAPPAGLPVADLPVVADSLEAAHAVAAAKSSVPIKVKEQGLPSSVADAAPANDDVIAHDIAAAQSSGSSSKLGSIVKTALPYVLVFGIGIFLYIFYFKNVDFSSWFKPAQQTVATPKQTVLAQLEQQNLADYKLWVNTFYFDVSDPKVTDPETDNSGNGLTNFEKYLLNLNPKMYDTLGLGRSDTESLAMGINPLTGNALTPDQKTIVDKYIDIEVAMNRLTLNHLQNPNIQNNQPGAVAGAATQTPGGLRGPEMYYGGVPTPTPTPSQSDTRVNLSGPETSYATQNLNELSIDTSKPGRLQVPSLKMDVPIMWTADPKDFDKDLQSGVVHYPGTAMPGQIGTTYIAGHSSNYAWAKGSFNHVFTHIDQMANNTSFTITVTQTNGKQAVLNYVVTSQQQFTPTDQAQFQNQAKSIVALSTCWPVNSTAKRLVVFGELTQVQK